MTTITEKRNPRSRRPRRRKQTKQRRGGGTSRNLGQPRLPLVVVEYRDGLILGELFMRNDHVVVLVNQLSEHTDFGKLQGHRDTHASPETSYVVVPAALVRSITEMEIDDSAD